MEKQLIFLVMLLHVGIFLHRLINLKCLTIDFFKDEQSNSSQISKAENKFNTQSLQRIQSRFFTYLGTKKGVSKRLFSISLVPIQLSRLLCDHPTVPVSGVMVCSALSLHCQISYRMRPRPRASCLSITAQPRVCGTHTLRHHGPTTPTSQTPTSRTW